MHERLKKIASQYPIFELYQINLYIWIGITSMPK